MRLRATTSSIPSPPPTSSRPRSTTRADRSQTVTSNLTIPNGVLTATRRADQPGTRARGSASTPCWPPSPTPTPTPSRASSRPRSSGATARSSVGFILPDQQAYDVRGSHLYLAGRLQHRRLRDRRRRRPDRGPQLGHGEARHHHGHRPDQPGGRRGRRLHRPDRHLHLGQSAGASPATSRRPSTGATTRTTSSPPSRRRPCPARSSSPGRTCSTTARTTRSPSPSSPAAAEFAGRQHDQRGRRPPDDHARSPGGRGRPGLDLPARHPRRRRWVLLLPRRPHALSSTGATGPRARPR